MEPLPEQSLHFLKSADSAQTDQSPFYTLQGDSVTSDILLLKHAKVLADWSETRILFSPKYC